MGGLEFNSNPPGVGVQFELNPPGVRIGQFPPPGVGIELNPPGVGVRSPPAQRVGVEGGGWLESALAPEAPADARGIVRRAPAAGNFMSRQACSVGL